MDTHAFLWAGDTERDLPPRMAELYRRTDVDCGLSVASIWEIAIKVSLGKLRLPRPLPDAIEAGRRQGIRLVPIRSEHLYRLQELPFHHRDPFDRLLAATCLVEGRTLLSVDTAFDAYGVLRVG
jgi:PIN domain nuclease of toxin-antitoxin system